MARPDQTTLGRRRRRRSPPTRLGDSGGSARRGPTRAGLDRNPHSDPPRCESEHRSIILTDCGATSPHVLVAAASRTLVDDFPASSNMAFFSFFSLSEDARERINRSIAVAHNVLHYGWVPFVLYVGFARSSPKPSLIKLISPLA
ncbi:unnamed protein product [Parajaminaea phylloscopi]